MQEHLARYSYSNTVIRLSVQDHYDVEQALYVENSSAINKES